MNLRHLIFAYCLTWILQLGYFSFILLGWRRLRQRDSKAGIDKN